MASIKALLDAMESPNYNIHLADDGIDPLLINKCKFYDRYIEYALTAPEYVAHEQSMKEVKALLNYSDSDSFEWYMVHDELESRRIMRMNLPYGMTEDMKNEIYDMRKLEFKMEYCNENASLLEQFLKVSSGQLISEELIKHFESDEKFIVYAAHEESLAPFVNIIMQEQMCAPTEFAAMMELRFITNDKGEQVVELDYNGEPQKLRACNGFRCLKTTFIDDLKTWAITEEDRAVLCNMSI